MILVDANLLLYAANRSAPEHEPARAWLDDHLSGTARVGLPWPSLLAFVRLVSNPLVVRHPETEDGKDCPRRLRQRLGRSRREIPGSAPRRSGAHPSPRRGRARRRIRLRSHRGFRGVRDPQRTAAAGTAPAGPPGRGRTRSTPTPGSSATTPAPETFPERRHAELRLPARPDVHRPSRSPSAERPGAATAADYHREQRRTNVPSHRRQQSGMCSS